MPPTIVNGLFTANAPVDVLGAVSCVEVPPTRVSRGATDEGL